MKRRILYILISPLLFITFYSSGQETKGEWIWYPGDFDIWLSNEVQTRRTERDVFIPPFWRMDSHYSLTSFHKEVNLEKSEEIMIFAEGDYNISLNGAYVQGNQKKVIIPKGKQQIKILVYNPKSPPAILVHGKTINSDKSWLVSAQDNHPIQADSWTFNQPESPPSSYKLATKPQEAENKEQVEGGVLVDFGRETFGFLKFHNLLGEGNITLYYGESKIEALDTNACETLDRLTISKNLDEEYTVPNARAFRYVYIVADKSIKFSNISMLYEFLPVDYAGEFKSSDEELNRIWDVAAYTLHLSTREFFLDGIKRDRWIWSGDAYQSYLMNYYLFFDNASVKRTTWAVRGKDPVKTHLNTIMDYSFYWFMGIYDYYLFTGDVTFVEQIYPRMLSLMEFCLQRTNKEGMVEGLPGDWVFLDWAPIPKSGELSAEQLLFCRSLETMALCADLMGDQVRKEKFQKLADDLRTRIFKRFWDEDQKALVHHYENGNRKPLVTKYANMFAIMFGYLDAEKILAVKENVLLNPHVQKITTPYMRFYELEALCAIGEQKHVLKEIKDYWGGMLKLGATSFWEAYDPENSGAEHYAMYGRPYGKSLCHAWGASPIYLLGKYYLGVSPITSGYEEYEIAPSLGGLDWMEGKVPSPNGPVKVYMNKKIIRISTASKGKGTLKISSSEKPISKGSVVKMLAENQYEIILEAGKEYVINYKALMK